MFLNPPRCPSSLPRKALACALLLAGLLCASPASAEAELEPALRRVLAEAPARVPVIVHLRPGVALNASGPERREALVRGLRGHTGRAHGRLRALFARHGGDAAQELWAAQALALELSPAALAELALQPEVERISLDALLSAPVTQAAGAAPPAWNLDALNARSLWQAGIDGSGAVIALLDTGADPEHPDLHHRFRDRPSDWYDPHGQHASPHDAHGHGTQVLGLALGGAAGGTPIGVAPGAQWIAAKVFDDAGLARISSVHLALQWALDPDGDPAVDDAPDVVLSAWGLHDGGGACSREFERDLAALKAADVAVVFAAGNDGPAPASGLTPAALPDSLATGALDEQLQVPGFSARGPSGCDGGIFPKLAAPGVNLRTSDLSFGGLLPDSYTQVSGTSFAAAHVAGALALLRSALPGASAAQLESALFAGARDLGPPGADDAYGNGLADPYAAWTRLLALTGRDPEGALLTVRLDHRWQTLPLAATLAPPVLIAGPPGGNGGHPGVVQVNGVEAAGARLRFAEWDYLDGWHLPEQLGLLALAPGRWHGADGSVWEMGRFGLDGSGVFQSRRFESSFGGTPALFLTVQSRNGGQPVTVRARRVSSSGFEAALFEEEAHMDGHVAEEVGYLAIHQPRGGGSVSLGGIPLAYALERVELDHRWSALAGGHWLRAQEEQSADGETWHLPEQVEVLELGGQLFAQDVSSRGRDTITLRRR